MIKSFYMENKDKSTINFDFNKDLNILTGKNGVGKTTTLKIIWYILSGNIDRALEEIEFTYVSLFTEVVAIRVGLLSENWSERGDEYFTLNALTQINELINIRSNKKETGIDSAYFLEVIDLLSGEVIAGPFINQSRIFLTQKISEKTSSSVFFPTFRRIEGGYSSKHKGKLMKNYRSDLDDEIEQVMRRISSRISNYDHSFITSVSTKDIVALMTEKYADNSERINKLHTELSEFIEDNINRVSDNTLDESKEILNKIQMEVRNVSKDREELLKPFSLLDSLIEKLFQHKGIQITDNIILGEKKEAVYSEYLSAGEKQMLSFICYNAFFQNSVIFIDEPEISLNVDWQRILFPTLLAQGTNNQFIISTHSPFIYSKYEDKEFPMDEDRGYESVEET